MSEWLKDFEKKFGKGSLRTAADISPISYRPSGSIALDVALGGGWGCGKIASLTGKEGSGKTLLFELAAVEAWKHEQKKSLLFDFEGTHDPSRFLALGGDPKALDVINHESCDPMLLADSAFDMAKMVLTNGDDYACICFDSTGSMMTAAEYEKKMDEGQAASAPFHTARVMSEGLRILVGLLARNPLKPTAFFVSQGRDNIGAMSFRGIPVDDKQTGGRALPFFASQIVRVTRGDHIKADVEELDLKGVEIGHITKIKVKKNKLNRFQGRTCEFNLYSEGEVRGIDKLSELVGLATLTKVITQSGSWFDAPDFGIHVQGRAQLREALAAQSLAQNVEIQVRKRLEEIMDEN